MRLTVTLTLMLALGFPAYCSAEPEKLTIPPRIYADFDLSEYKTPAQAKTTTIAKIDPKTINQPVYLGLHLEQRGNSLRVVEVDQQSPAAEAGILPGDLLLKFAGKITKTKDDLRERLKVHSPNDTVDVHLERDGKTRDLKVTLVAVSAPLSPSGPGQRPFIGIQTVAAEKGVRISSITAGSPAEKAGVKVGDILLSIAQKPTQDAERVSETITDKKPGDKVTLSIIRDGKELAKEIVLASANPDGTPSRSWDSRATRIFRKPIYRLAVLPIGYPDLSLNEKIPLSAWDDALFSKGTYHDKSITGQPVYGSLRDYYLEQSCGAVDVVGKVFVPVKATKKRQDYANTTTRNALLGEAIDLLREREGKDVLKEFDGIFFLYAGETAATQVNALYWPHRGSLNHKSERFSYFICPEGGAKMYNISTIGHEFGHMLGLPDLYAKQEVPGSEGLGSWCAMSQQIRNGRPQHFCAWSKEQMHWIQPTVIDPAVPQKLILAPIEGTTGECFKVLVHTDGSEYFLLENRKKTGFDSDLPGEGLLIWRVVDNKPILEESHGISGPTGPRSFPASVPYPSKANHSFTPLTTPSSKSLKGGGNEVHITNIRRLPDGKIVFQIGFNYL